MHPARIHRLVYTLKERPGRPASMALSDSLWDLCQRCWSHEPHHRPSMWDVFQALSNPTRLAQSATEISELNPRAAAFVPTAPACGSQSGQTMADLSNLSLLSSSAPIAHVGNETVTPSSCDLHQGPTTNAVATRSYDIDKDGREGLSSPSCIHRGPPVGHSHNAHAPDSVPIVSRIPSASAPPHPPIVDHQARPSATTKLNPSAAAFVPAAPRPTSPRQEAPSRSALIQVKLTIRPEDLSPLNHFLSQREGLLPPPMNPQAQEFIPRFGRLEDARDHATATTPLSVQSAFLTDTSQPPIESVPERPCDPPVLRATAPVFVPRLLIESKLNAGPGPLTDSPPETPLLTPDDGVDLGSGASSLPLTPRTPYGPVFNPHAKVFVPRFVNTLAK